MSANLLVLRCLLLVTATLSLLRVRAADAPPATPAPLTVVGVLGNSAGLSDQPFPYAYYCGIAADNQGRLFLAGAEQGIVVSDQDGQCLAALPLVGSTPGLAARSLLVRAGDAIYGVGVAPGGVRSALFRVATTGAAPTLKLEWLAEGAGHWAVSPTLTAAGEVVLGQSLVAKHQYTVVTVAPATGQLTTRFTAELPDGATSPWRHLIQVDADGSISIEHSGGRNWGGRYTLDGTRVGEVRTGQLVGPYRYHFGYEGGLRRMDATDEQVAPGDCGAPAPEIRMPAQLAQVGERLFIAGRGGALEAHWTGAAFTYPRRIGALSVAELADDGANLLGVAYTSEGNQDVQHLLRLPKDQAIGPLLPIGEPLHGLHTLALVPATEGAVLATTRPTEVSLHYRGVNHLEFDLKVPAVKAVGQMAVQGTNLLLADPQAGTVWRRPLLDKRALPTAWLTGRAGVTAVAVSPAAVFVATATHVTCLSPDGQQEQWTASETYRGIRRLAATGDYVYVCDTDDAVVDQLDAHTGKLLARLGVRGEPGATLTHLRHPLAVAADPNGVYIADTGNGRVLVATTTLWRPAIATLSRAGETPVTAVTLPITPPAAGRLSLNLYDQHDLTVRQLVCATPVAAGAVTPLGWDGKDLLGRYVAPGTYRYHAALTPHLTLRYITSIGQSGTPPTRTPDGTGSWGGVWGNVMAVCPVTAAPDSDIVVLWAFEEGEGGLIRMSQDGQVRWKSHLDWWLKASQMALASDGTHIFIACASAMNAPSGQQNYGGDLRRPLLWRVDAATGAQRLYEKDHDREPMYGDYKPGDHIVTDLVYRDGKLYLTAPAMGQVYVVDAADAKLLQSWPVAGASGLAFAADGTARVGSGEQIVTLDPAGKVTGTWAKAGGQIWALRPTADGGVVATVDAPRHQVVYFDAQGKERRALGVAGGRPLAGAMQPASFREPVGLGVTGGGTLFVAENATPRRFTRWSADGKLEREFHGPYYFSGMFGVDEDEPEWVYGDTHSDLIRYRVDYSTGKWSVEHYWIGAYTQAGVPIKWWPRIRHRDGKTYWCSGSGAIAEVLDDRIRGVAAIYGGWVGKQDDGNYAPRAHTKNTGLKGTWSDLNGDGLQQAEEWQVTDHPTYPATASGPQQGWGIYFDADFKAYMHDWSDGAEGGVWQLSPEWQKGVPVYHWDQAQHVGLPLGRGLAHGGSGARTAFAEGNAVYGFNGAYNAAGLPGVGHGHDWEFSQITRYDATTGQPQWFAGQRTAGYAVPGDMYCPTGAAGTIGDLLFWTDENSLVHVWEQQHGLYVDTLLEDTQRAPPPTPTTVWVELFNTRVFRHPKTGKVYLLAGSDAIHIYEVLGTDQKLQRFDGEVTITAADIARAQQEEKQRVVTRQRTLAIKAATAPVTLASGPTVFASATPVALPLRPDTQAVVRLLADATNLYAEFTVTDPSPWKNAGGDVTALFKTGDEVSVWLGPSAGARAPGLGDLRVLIAPDGQQARVVLYRPKVAAGAKPVSFRSPSGELRLDQVAETIEVATAVTVTAAGYRVVAIIPWALSGLDPSRGPFGLDLSVNFSDPAGQRNVARLHWGRNGGAMVYDLPTEARFEPATWGTATVGQ